MKAIKTLILALASSVMAACATAEVAYIDVMFALDKKAVDYLTDTKGTNVNTYIEQQLVTMNQVLTNSGLDDKFQFRSAGVYELGFEAVRIDSSKQLTRDVLENATGGKGIWEDLHTERDNRGADVVSVIIDTGSEYGHVGDGNALTSIAAADVAAFSESAYSVVGVRSTFAYYAILHEIAHNMGAGHALETSTTDQSTTYSHGYNFTAEGQGYYTVMGYPNNSATPPTKPIPYFSTPNKTYKGVAVGTSNRQNNAYVLEQTCQAVSQWRSLPAKAHPTMSVSWNQQSPMNDFSAVAKKDGAWEKAPCGCAATAAAQMFKHYAWPMRTDASFTGMAHRYLDNDADDFPIRFDGHNDFQWAKMKDHASDNDVIGNFETARMTLWCDAMAGMDFRVGDSSAQFDDIAESASEWFKKGKSTYFSSDGAEAVWKAITNALDRGEIVQVTLKGHQVVADDYKIEDNTLKIHLNYGWAGSQTDWYTTAQLSDQYSGILYVWTGFAPKKMAQMKPLAKQSPTSIPLSWSVPAKYADELTGFNIMCYYPGNSVVSSYTGDTGTMAADRAGTYFLKGAFKLTDASKMSYSLSSYHTAGIKVELQSRFDAGEWETIATPAISTDEDVYDKGTLISSGWRTTSEELNLGSYAGKTAEFRFKVSRTAKTRTNDGQLFFAKPVWSQVYQPNSSQFGLPNYKTLRSLSFPASDYAGKVVSLTIEPIMSDSVVGEPVATKVVTTAVPDQPAVVSIDSLSSSMANGFQRTCGIGKSVFFVKGNETTTAVAAAPSHLALVPDSNVSCSSVGDHTWAVTIDAEGTPANSQMILTLIAQDALGNKSYKDLQLTFASGEGGAEPENTLADRIAAGNFLYVPSEASETLPLDDTRFVAGRGTVVFDGGMPSQGPDRGFNYQDSWKGLVKFVNFTPTQDDLNRINYEFKNVNSEVQIGGDPKPTIVPIVQVSALRDAASPGGGWQEWAVGSATPSSAGNYDKTFDCAESATCNLNSPGGRNFGTTRAKQMFASDVLAARLADIKAAMGFSADIPESVYWDGTHNGQDQTATITFGGLDNTKTYTLCFIGGTWNRIATFSMTTYAGSPTVKYVSSSGGSPSTPAATTWTDSPIGTDLVSGIGKENNDNGVLMVLVSNIQPSNGQIVFKSKTQCSINAFALSRTGIVPPTPDFTVIGKNSPTGWFTGWKGEQFNNDSQAVGPGVYGQIYAANASRHPYKDYQVPETFSLAVYCDPSLYDASGSKYIVIAAAGTTGGNRAVLCRKGNKVYLRTAGGDISVNMPSGGGYHLYTATYTTTGATLTCDNDTAHTATLTASLSRPATGFQIGGVYGGIGSEYEQATSLPIAAVLGFNKVLSADEIGALSAAYPAANAGSFADMLTLDNGLMSIQSGFSASAKSVRFGNNSGSNAATLNLGGVLNVTGASTKSGYTSAGVRDDVVNKRGGILLGEWTGVGTYNITGTLNARNNYLQMRLDAGAQTMNINGGTVSVKGLTTKSGNTSTINLTNGGTLEIAEILSDAGTITRNYNDGTVRALGDINETQAITLGGTGAGTTFDANGHTFTLSGALSGTGKATIANSGSGGKVVVPEDQFKGELTVAEGATLDITGAAEQDSYTITAGTFTNSGTVQLNGVDLPTADYEVSGNLIVKKGAPTPTGDIHAEIASGATTDWSAIEWYNASEQKIGTITDFSQVTSAALTIANAGAVTIDNATFSDLGTKLTITGSGTLVYDATLVTTFPTTAPTGLSAAGWTGTVWFKGYNSDSADRTVENFRNAGSTVKFTSVKGFFAAQSVFNAVALEDAGDTPALNIDNGYGGWGSDKHVEISNLTGTGTLKVSWGGGGYQGCPLTLVNLGDFHGSLWASAANGIGIYVGPKLSSWSSADNGKITLVAGGAATIAEGKSWTAVDGIVINGAIGGAGTLASNATFGDGAEIDVRNGTLNATGTLTFGASTKVRVVTTPTAEVKIINKSGTTAGEISTTVSVYVGSSETSETRDFTLAYKTDGVYLVGGESPYAKFDYGTVYSWATTGSGAVDLAGASDFYEFDIVGCTNKTTLYHGNQEIDSTLFWKRFAYAATHNTNRGQIIRLQQGSYCTTINGTYGAMSFGGIVAEDGDTSYTIEQTGGTRYTVLGDPKAEVATYFDIFAGVTFNRNGDFALSGTLTFDIANGKTFGLNASRSSTLELVETVAAGNDGKYGATTAGGALIMKGDGTLAVNTLKALGSTLDYSNIPLSRETAYISGALTINDATVIKLPAGLAENTPFKMATTLSGATSGERTIWIGETEVVKYVTFDAANGTISYSATVEYKYLGWNGSAWTNAQGVATAVDNTCILNAKDGDVITFASAVTPHQFNMPETGTVTLNDQQNLSVGTVAIPSAATLVIKANNTFSPALTGSGTLSVNPGQVKFNGQNNLPASNFANFTGKLQMASGRLQDYSAVLPSAVTIEILNGAQMYFGTALTWENNFVFKGNGWTGESNIWIYGPARFDRDVTLSGSVTFDRDGGAPQILMASGKTLTLNGAVSAPHGFTTAGSSGTVKLTTVANDTIAGTVTLDQGDLWYGTGKDSGGTSGTSYKCGDTIIVKTGRTFNLHPWTTTQTDDSESNKVILASDIDMLGGTFHVEDGSYVFSGDFNVSSNSTLDFKWAKGRIIKSLKGGLDVTLTVNSANSDTSVSKNYFKDGDFAGTLKLTGSGTGAYCIPYDTALAKATVSPESGWDICLTQNATIGTLNGGQSVFGDGTASPTLTLKGGVYSGAFMDKSDGKDAAHALSLTIDGEVSLSALSTTTLSGMVALSANSVLNAASTTQQSVKTLTFGLGSTLVINTNATAAAMAVTDAVDLQGGALRLAGVLPAEGGTVKLLSATGGILNYENALEGRGDWTLNYAENTLSATKAKATYVSPGEGGIVTDAGNDADSLDISMTLAKSVTAKMPTKVTDSSSSAEVVSALNQTGANTYKVWESAVLGLEPSEASSQLVITPIQGSNANKVTLKVPEVNVDPTTGADVTFCFWSKTADGEWEEVPGGVVDSGEAKELDLPENGVKYYQLRTTIKAGQVTPVPTVIPSANIVASGAPILTTPGTQYAASMGTTTLDEVSSSLTVALAGAGVYEGQEYHLEVTEPANDPVQLQAKALKLTTSTVDSNANDENHYAIVAKAAANKTVTFIFGKNVPAGTTCKLTLLSASGAPNGNIKVASSGFSGPTYADVMVMARLADMPMNDGFGGQSGHNGYRIPALATDGAGEVIACYDVRQFGSADWSDLGVPAGAGIDIGESYSDSRGVNFDKPRLGIDVENYYHADGTKESTWTKDKDIGDVSIVWDPSRSQYWLMGITGKGLTNCDGTNLNDVVLYTRAKGRGTAWTEWHNPDLAGETEKLKYRSIQHTVLKQTGLASCGRGFLEGPGHGMVTKIGSKDGTTIPIGTVVFPVQYFLSSDTSNIHAGAIYLKPGEITTANNWVATGRTPGSSGPQENCVMELDDGSWYMMCKYSTNYKAWRTTNYQDWVDVNDGLTGVAHVQGSCLRIGVDANNVGQYVFCHANDTSRQKLTLFFGVDTTKGETGTIPSTTNKGVQWDLQNGIMIDIGPCGGMTYNSMCMLDDHTLGILYETQWHIQFVRIDVSDKVVPPAK